MDDFVEQLVYVDNDSLLTGVVWTEFSGPIRMLLDNQYVFQPFWDFHNGKIPEAEWLERFAKSKQRATVAVGKSDTHRVMALIISRLYTLRNQMIHGGATWNSQVNRDQVRDAVNILGKLVPIIIHLMMENPAAPWGECCYPVVKP